MEALTAEIKAKIVEALQAVLKREREQAQASHDASVEAATHSDCRAEHAKDARATMASFLARGMAQRVAEKKLAIDAFRNQVYSRQHSGDEPVTLGALLRYENDHSAGLILLVEAGMAAEVEVEGQQVRAISVLSPMGRAFLGAELGDEVVVQTPKGERCFELIDLV